MVYFFCNQSYGLKLLQVAVDYSKRNNMPLCVILSQKRSVPVSFWKKSAFWLRDIVRKLVEEKRLSTHYGVPVIVMDDVNLKGFQKRIEPESHGIIAGFNQIFRGETISKFETFVNFHPSILPLYRGPTPSHWCIRNGERLTGYTLHEVTEAIDEGRVIFQEVIEIRDEPNDSALDQKIALAACSTLEKYLEHLAENTPWEEKLVDAYDVYSTHISYASFPEI